MNSWKVDVIQSWEVLRLLIYMQIFIDFCNFYWWFIKNFSKITQSIIKLIQKDYFFKWTEICQMIFEELKQQMMTVLVLKHFNSIRETILKTNFLNYVNDEVLSQYDDEDILHSVIFYSKNMILAECNYEIYDKELLIIIRCLKHWCLELKCMNISIKIFIDHLNLKYFMIIKELIRWQARWAEKLSEYNFKIIYQSKKQQSESRRVDQNVRRQVSWSKWWSKAISASDAIVKRQIWAAVNKSWSRRWAESWSRSDSDLTQIWLRFETRIER